MKRLVYSPKVTAFVKADSGVYDLTDHITQFNVTRKINQVSTAELTLRNPNKVWTERTSTDPVTKKPTVGPVFHPMDPITIILTRLPNRPVQVFTGYCDSTPYLQLFPGTVTLSASCTLKKLLYTYFDPGLPFFWEFLSEHGWTPNFLQGGISNFKAEKEHGEPSKEKGGVRYGDSGIGELLYDTLHVIGGWPDETIYIEEIPVNVIDLVANLFEVFKNEAEESQSELKSFLHEIVGSAAFGGGGPGGEEGESSPVRGTVSGTNMTPAHAEFVKLLAGLTGLSLKVIGAWVAYENGPADNPLNIGGASALAHYGTVKAAANETSKLLHGSLYKGIMASVGKSDQQQCAAIAESSWCPGCAGYEEALLSLLNNIHVKADPQGQIHR